MSFVIARQRVYDAEGEIYGYEVFLRRKGQEDRYPTEVSYNKATFIVAELIAELGIQRVSDGKNIFMNVTLDSILNRSLDLLPLRKMIFEVIPSNVEIGQSVYSLALKRIDSLRKEGSLFALSEDLYSGKFVELLERVYIVEFSAKNLDEGKSSAVRRNNKKVLVSKIETQEDYERVKPLGDFFQGYYFDKPQIIKEFEVAPFLKTTLMRMIGALNTARSIKEFAQIVASDVGMSAKLLRFVNSAYFAKRKEIKDIVQACSYLGMANLRKFTLLIAANDYMSVENPNLWRKSLIRAILSEEIAKKLSPSLANEAYLVGLFSLIDEILGVDKVEFLKEVSVDERIIKAYTGEEGTLHRILNIVEKLTEAEYEEIPEELLEEVSKESGVPKEFLKEKLLEAVAKAEDIIKL